MPTYQYAISGVTEALLRKDPIFEEVLPSSRHKKKDGKNPGCGSFLEGVACFLEGHLPDLESRYGQTIETVRIILEKHGALYHPCRVHLNGLVSRPVVVNGAVTEEAIRIMVAEVRALQALWDRGIRDIPEVFFTEEVTLSENIRASFFAAPWFGGFCEFHWSLTGKNLELRVWEEGGERRILEKQKVASLFHKIAVILTRSYDFDTFSQIFPWHHAAGDFVVRVQGLDVDVRLITVRQYENLFLLEGAFADFSDKIEALSRFLWNMLLRMRLDRLDGVGDLVWAPDFVVSSALSGFCEALSEKAILRKDIAMVMEALPEIVFASGKEDLFETHREIIAAYNAHAPEISLLHENVREHSNFIYDFFRHKKETQDALST